MWGLIPKAKQFFGVLSSRLKLSALLFPWGGFRPKASLRSVSLPVALSLISYGPQMNFFSCYRLFILNRTPWTVCSYLHLSSLKHTPSKNCKDNCGSGSWLTCSHCLHTKSESSSAPSLNISTFSSSFRWSAFQLTLSSSA